MIGRGAGSWPRRRQTGTPWVAAPGRAPPAGTLHGLPRRSQGARSARPAGFQSTARAPRRVPASTTVDRGGRARSEGQHHDAALWIHATREPLSVGVRSNVRMGAVIGGEARIAVQAVVSDVGPDGPF